MSIPSPYELGYKAAGYRDSATPQQFATSFESELEPGEEITVLRQCQSVRRVLAAEQPNCESLGLLLEN